MAELPPDDQTQPDDEEFRLPVEVEIYIDPDGTVVFADLEEGTLPLARQLDPDWQQGEGTFCVPEQSDEPGEDTNNNA